MDVASNPKAGIRLIRECEKTKKLMSANSQEIPLNIECLMEDRDVTGKFKRYFLIFVCSVKSFTCIRNFLFCFRADFEDKIASLLLQLEATLKSLLEKSGNVNEPES